MSFSLKSENGFVHISFDVNLCFYLRASGITLSGIAFKQRHRLPAYHHRIRRRKEVRLYSSHKNGVLGTTANDNYTHVNQPEEVTANVESSESYGVSQVKNEEVINRVHEPFVYEPTYEPSNS